MPASKPRKSAKVARKTARKTVAKAGKKAVAKPTKKARPASKPAAKRVTAKVPAKSPARKATKTSGKAKSGAKAAPKSITKANPKAAPQPTTPVLLSGGNPQIAKGDGDAPVQAYIAAMPGWKRDAGRRLDKLIGKTVPDVRKAVKWNSPFYGMEGQGWFLAIHCFTSYIKVAFFRGAALSPPPPVDSKDPHARYFHIQEGEHFDEKLVASWIRQASQIPGWIP